MDYCDKSGKKCYDKKTALTAKNKRFKEDHVVLRLYFHEFCNSWHLTSKEHYDEDFED